MPALALALNRLAPLRVALVNNMPDGAFRETEEQFGRLLEAYSSRGVGAVLDLYTLPGIPRSDVTRADIRHRYADLEVLWERPPDALIVTGTEPVQDRLPDEPYWGALTHLLQWAADRVPAVMLSCLAAHAALLAFDGIERLRRPRKCCGIYAGRVDTSLDPLSRGLGTCVPVPHSRFNEVTQSAIIDAGYRVVVGAGELAPSWSVAARTIGNALFVLCQGHPEYSTLSLLREYRRDVRRYLLGHGTSRYPLLPEGYLDPASTETLREFERRAVHPESEPYRSWAAFPYDQVAGRVANTWADSAVTLYGNWLSAASLASASAV